MLPPASGTRARPYKALTAPYKALQGLDKPYKAFGVCGQNWPKLRATLVFSLLLACASALLQSTALARERLALTHVASWQLLRRAPTRASITPDPIHRSPPGSERRSAATAPGGVQCAQDTRNARGQGIPQGASTTIRAMRAVPPGCGGAKRARAPLVRPGLAGRFPPRFVSIGGRGPHWRSSHHGSEREKQPCW